MKAALRDRMRALRTGLPKAIRRRAGEEIRDRVLELALPGPVMAFVSVRGEVGTRLLIEALGDRVAVPRIDGEQLVCCRLTEWVDGPLGIPTSAGPEVQPQVVLVPGLAFDIHGGRLGYGGGFYDRFLNTHPHARAIALGYDFQLVDRVPMEAHDVHIPERILASTAR